MDSSVGHNTERGKDQDECCVGGVSSGPMGLMSEESSNGKNQGQFFL